MPCFLLAVLLGSWSVPPAFAGPDCLFDYPVGVFVSYRFTDAQGATRQGTNDGAIYSQLSGRLRASGAKVVEIAATSGKQALARTKDQARLLALFELIAHARPIALPGGQRTSWQDVQIQASLRIIDAPVRRQLGSATDTVTAAGLSIEDALPTALPSLMDRLTTAALTQACALLPAKPTPQVKIERVAEQPKPDLEAEREALNLISKTADSICTRIPVEGEGKDVTLTGDASAKLNDLFSKIVDLGIEGSGKLESAQYKGVLQKELAQAIKDSNACRLAVFEKLSTILLSSSPHGTVPTHE